MRAWGSAAVCAGLIATTMTGCSPASACDVGEDSDLHLTVQYTSPVEPAVRFCSDGQCSPIPGAGPIPKLFIDRSQDHGALVRRTGQGTWSIWPRGRSDAPTTAKVELYEDGRRIPTSTVHLRWPEVDPCAASFPPEPHPTVSAG